MHDSFRPLLLRYGVAVPAVAIAALVRLALDPVLGEQYPVATLFFAILVAAGYGGQGPALVTTALGAIVAARFLIPPRVGFASIGVENRAGMVVYLAVGVGISILGGSMRSARRRAEINEAAAVEHREWLRVTLTSIGDAVIATDGDRRVRFMNLIAEKMTGWTQTEAVGRAIDEVLQIVTERTSQTVESPVDRVIREGRKIEPAKGTIVIARDGTETAIENDAAPILDASGKVIGVVMVLQDATERRRYEKALRESEERPRVILESIADAFVALDRDWRFSYVNRQAEVLISRSRTDLLGKSFWVEFAPTIGTVTERCFRQAMAEDIAVTFEVFYPPHNRWYEAQAYPSPDGLSIYFRDVSERRLADEDNTRLLASSEHQRRVYETALSNTPDHNYIFDLDGRFVFANRSLLELWQSRMSEVIGRDFFELGYPHDLATRLHKQIQQVIETRQAVRDETPFTAQQNERQYDYIFVPVLGADGCVEAVVGSTRDITERRRNEDVIRTAKEEAEDANRAKDDFLAVLSHELRTPLNPILLATTAMLDRPMPAEEVGPTMEMIRQNVSLQARLIDDLLDVMRIVRGKMPLHWSVCDCHELITRAIEICRSETLPKAQRIMIEMAAVEHGSNADPARIQQVLWNLLKNAIKFTPEGGTITVRTHNDGEHIVIEVADTGLGIEPDILPHIFDAFHQGDARITRKFGGLGLGLAICRGVVEAHGGTIAAESPGRDRGTTFRIALTTTPLPISATGVAVVSDKKLPPPVLNRMTILVVEDEPTTLRLMAKLLAGLGHEIITAGTLEDAWESFRSADGFDLIVSDLGLPDGSGLDLMRRVSTMRSVPAIALTGYGMDEDIRRSREAGFTTHMTKPIDFVKLEAMILQVAPTGSRMLEGQSPRSVP